MKKRSERRKHCTRALAVVRFGHLLLSQTHRQDRLQYTALQLASAQCKEAYAAQTAARALYKNSQ